LRCCREMRHVMALALALTACGGSSATRIGPKMYEIDCRRSRGNCWREAARVCPDGFDPLDSADHNAYVLSNGAVIPVYKSEMVVRCRGRERPDEEEMPF
jgi:hypothetical protein